MPFSRRLFLYFIGLVIGGGMAWWIYGERLTSGAWLPDHKIKQRLQSTLIAARPAAQTQLTEWPAVLSEVRAALPKAHIDLVNSRRTPDSLYYHVEATVNGRDALVIVAVLRDDLRDSTATLWDLRAR
jgi:hypothetical protein